MHATAERVARETMDSARATLEDASRGILDSARAEPRRKRSRHDRGRRQAGGEPRRRTVAEQLVRVTLASVKDDEAALRADVEQSSAASRRARRARAGGAGERGGGGRARAGRCRGGRQAAEHAHERAFDGARMSRARPSTLPRRRWRTRRAKCSSRRAPNCRRACAPLPRSRRSLRPKPRRARWPRRSCATRSRSAREEGSRVPPARGGECDRRSPERVGRELVKMVFRRHAVDSGPAQRAKQGRDAHGIAGGSAGSVGRRQGAGAATSRPRLPGGRRARCPGLPA